MRVDLAAMAAMAPQHDWVTLRGAADVLSSLQPLDPSGAEGLRPAVDFDPVVAAGGPCQRRFTVPATPRRRSSGNGTYTVADLAARVLAGERTQTEVTQAFRNRIETWEPLLHAFVTVAQPAAVEAPAGRLSGVPLGLKDLIDTAGVRTTCGSAIFAERVPDRDAAVWQRLAGAGAVMLGKLNTQEFAAGVTGENDHYGAVRNPRHLGHLAGGSSSGCAAAVAAGMLPAAVGSDTGGSVRIPAACCGVVGLKPTFGLVPTAGVYPLAYSLDHIGPLARTVADAALLLDVMAETNCEPAALAGETESLDGLRIGIAGAWAQESSREVRRAFTAATDALRRRGAELVDVEVPDADSLTAVNRIVTYAEESAVHEQLLTTGADYGDAIADRMQAGRFLLAGEYLTAQRLRRSLCERFGRLWQEIDALLTPTLPTTAPTVDATDVPVSGRNLPLGTAMVRYTAPFNLTGSPAISVPYGCADVGLPVGVQLATAPHGEGTLCYVAAALQAELGVTEPVDPHAP